MRDEQDREPEALFEVLDLLQDLFLHDHVERRRRLVQDNQLWIEGQCEGNHDPLAHAAREFVRIALQTRRFDPDNTE